MYSQQSTVDGEDKSILFFAAGSYVHSYAKLAYIRMIITMQQG